MTNKVYKYTDGVENYLKYRKYKLYFNRNNLYKEYNYMNKLINVIKTLIDIPNYKLEYILSNKKYVKGLWETLNHYGFSYNKDNHEELVNQVSNKLSSGIDIEYEWTENQYENFVKYTE